MQVSPNAWLPLNEEFRDYVTADGFVYRINQPVRMFVSGHGTIFVEDREGVVHVVTNDKFMVLRFLPKPDVLETTEEAEVAVAMAETESEDIDD